MNISRDRLLTELRTLDPYDFEHLVAEIWEYMGWETTVTSESQDGGVDIIARKSLPFQQKQFIQAKRYSGRNKIRLSDVQQYSSLYLNTSSKRDVDPDIVALVTTSSLTQPARNKANEVNLRIVNGEDLTEMLIKWDLSEIVSEYTTPSTESKSDRELDTSTSVESYRNTFVWSMFEEFNDMATSNSQDMQLTVSVGDTTAYTLIHGRSYQNHLEERTNIHYLRGLDDEQLDRLKHIANSLNMSILTGDEDDEWKIYDKHQGSIETRRTVEIGTRILNGIFDHSLEEADIDVSVGKT